MSDQYNGDQYNDLFDRWVRIHRLLCPTKEILK